MLPLIKHGESTATACRSGLGEMGRGTASTRQTRVGSALRPLLSAPSTQRRRQALLLPSLQQEVDVSKGNSWVCSAAEPCRPVCTSWCWTESQRLASHSHLCHEPHVSQEQSSALLLGPALPSSCREQTHCSVHAVQRLSNRVHLKVP